MKHKIRASAKKLTKSQIEIIQRPVRGSGGFQCLLRKIQKSIVDGYLLVTPIMRERARRYIDQYGDGGFQGRILRIAK